MEHKKPVLVLQHFAGNPPGRIGNILNERSIPYNVVQVERDQLGDATSYAAIVALGGTQHLYDKSKYPYTVREESFVRSAIEQQIPYLGMCLGGQLLANAFQASIRKLPKKQIGFLDIRFTEKGQHDPLYHGLPGQQLAFQWHEDYFMLPQSAVELAYHEDGSNQAFRYRDHAYGLQYHIEITREMFDHWLHDPSLKKEFVDAYGSEQYNKTGQEVEQLYSQYDSQARTIIENFLRISHLIERW